MKKRTAILRGGPSDEYEVSMKTGASVLEALNDSNDFELIDVIISRGGEWMVNGFTKTPEQALAAVDVVFIALHGSYGEDGTVQRILERLAIPYTGSRSYASNIAMNKILTKEHIAHTGIKSPRHMRVSKSVPDLARLVNSIEELFGPEYVIKPHNGGSSIDTHIVKGGTDLLYTLQKVLHDRNEVMVEEKVDGKEATVGVIENFRNERVYKLPVVEILPPPTATFFDYQNKYDGSTQEICPGRFSKEEKEMLETAAKAVHEALELSQYSRSDFIVADGDIYFLEVNTLPGLTAESLLPKSLDAVGFSYPDFVRHLLTDALERPRA